MNKTAAGALMEIHLRNSSQQLNLELFILIVQRHSQAVQIQLLLGADKFAQYHSLEPPECSGPPPSPASHSQSHSRKC